MNMRKSRVLRKIRSGETAFSFKLNLSDARVADIAAMAGFDCLWTDMEHTPMDYIALENIIRAAKGNNVKESLFAQLTEFPFQ